MEEIKKLTKSQTASSTQEQHKTLDLQHSPSIQRSSIMSGTSVENKSPKASTESQLERFLKACKEGNLREVQTIAAKSDITIIADNNRYTGLHVACLNNQTHIASFLID